MPELLVSSTPTPSLQRTESPGCRLCGLPVGRSKARLTTAGEPVQFCCAGCLHVYQILSNRPDGTPQDFRQTDLFKACVASGVIPPQESRPGREVPGSNSADASLAQNLTLRVEGMWCTACSWLIQEVLRKTKGMIDANVSFASDIAKVSYLPHLISADEIIEEVSRLGYRASRFEDRSTVGRFQRDLLLRLGVAAFFTMNVMMISVALYLGFFHELGKEGIRYLSYPIWALATPVVFYGGWPILKRGAAGLLHGALSMDTLVSIGALAAYTYSVLHVLNADLHLYFDTASMLMTILLIGRYIELRSRDHISFGMSELEALARQKVRLSGDEKERWVYPELVQPGQCFTVLSGERVPVDGMIISEKGMIDESVLTGETRPRRKKSGDEVMAGSLLLEGDANLGALRSGSETCLGQMIELMRGALVQKNRFEMVSERVMKWFVPAMLLLGGGTGLTLLFSGAGPETAFFRTLTVLVIACPCVLGIASPLAKVAAIAVAKERGMLVRNPAVLENMASLRAFVFDKTGTLTEGRFSLRKIVSEDQEEALRRVASVEMNSSHFIAKEIVREAAGLRSRIEPAEMFERRDGLGVTGMVFGSEVSVGNRKLMEKAGAVVSTQMEEEASRLECDGMTVIFFAWGGRCRGVMAFGDSIKEGSQETVETLKKEGREVWLLSGDSDETTRAVAHRLGIDHVRGNCLPKDKVDQIKMLQRGGRRVAMVGDGLNDAAALAQADVGIAMGSAITIAREAFDLHMFNDDPRRIMEVMRLSGRTRTIIRQNLTFAILYNAFGIPLAIGGLLNPLVSVVAMFMSSLSVIGNTLRIKRGG